MRIIDWLGTEKKYYKEDENIIKSTDYKEDENIIKNIDYKKKNNDSAKKYSLLGVFFICGLFVVSVVKNNTRNLEKEINNLKASNRLIQHNYEQALLDNEVITSPENISLLAREYLNTDFKFYKRSQIKNLDENLVANKKVKKQKKLTQVIKTKLQKNLKRKKKELKKLEAMYKKPNEIPEQIKTQLAKKINNKKNTIKKLYSSPEKVVSLEKIRKWGGIQIVKVFLGIPVVPGR